MIVYLTFPTNVSRTWDDIKSTILHFISTKSRYQRIHMYDLSRDKASSGERFSEARKQVHYGVLTPAGFRLERVP